MRRNEKEERTDKREGNKNLHIQKRKLNDKPESQQRVCRKGNRGNEYAVPSAKPAVQKASNATIGRGDEPLKGAGGLKGGPTGRGVNQSPRKKGRTGPKTFSSEVSTKKR